MTISIGVCIPTYRSKQHLSRCISPLLSSPLKPRILVIDSSSDDGTVEEAQGLGVETYVIPKAAFNHGRTREQGRQILGTEVVVMMTPDAYAVDAKMLERLLAPLLIGKAQIAYARQLPRPGAGPLEAFPRLFNYPESGHVRSIDDLDQMGIRTFFCSDSCAAYRQEVLDQVGGFPRVRFGEDMVVAAKAVRAGYRIAYVAEALVYHSHAFSLGQEFRRYFEIGALHGQYRDLLACPAGRGRAYVRALQGYLMRGHRRLLAYAYLQCLIKWAGYHVGRRSALRKRCRAEARQTS